MHHDEIVEDHAQVPSSRLVYILFAPRGNHLKPQAPKYKKASIKPNNKFQQDNNDNNDIMRSTSTPAKSSDIAFAL
jgi:hypothetical protein